MPARFTDFLYENHDELLLEKSRPKIANMTPQQHAHFRQSEEEGIQFHKDNPISHHNIVHHFEQATPEEHHSGMHWYSDAHHTAKALAHDTGLKHHQMAGLIGIYSPQTMWHTNVMTAARVGREKRGMGGPGSGVYASNRTREGADRILKGEHYNNVFAKNSHKIKHFTHLIEHGGNEHPDKPHVAIDRHAYSVAAGKRLTDAAFEKAGLNSPKKYGQVHAHYVKAAEHLSKTRGMTIHPHQVQAVTWLVRQRKNAEEEGAKGAARLGKTANKAIKAKHEWDKYAGEFHPHLIGHDPGHGYGGGGTATGTKFHKYPLA